MSDVNNQSFNIIDRFRSLCRVAHNLESDQLITPYRRVLSHLIEQNTFDADNKGYHGLLRLMDMGLIVTNEMHLGTVSLSALFFYRAYYKQTMSEQEIRQLCPAGTFELIELLMTTSEIFMRQHQVSSDDFQQYIITVAQDIRVVLILLSDRLNTLRQATTYLTKHERRSLAIEIQNLFIPLAHRLGLYKIKGEMEDLCLKYTDPEQFYQIKSLLGEKKLERDAYMTQFIEPIASALDSDQFNHSYSIKARTKSIHSIYKKIVNKGVQFNDIYDLSAIRIIIDCPIDDERKACWNAYSIVTNIYEPNTKRLRDWVTVPKENGYESLHITVQTPEGKSVEVQIRTKRMDAIAERGVAAHWLYKGIKAQGEFDNTLTSIREALETIGGKDLSKGKNPLAMSVKLQTVFAFTPTGQMIKLPVGATVLDFAFAIHSNVGCQAQSAIINDKNVALRTKLRNGDIVEIIRNKNQTPSLDWLNLVVTRKAKSKIHQTVRIQQEKGLEAAKELFDRRLKNRKLALNESIFNAIIRKMGYSGNMDFFIALSENKVNVNHFLEDYESRLAESESSTPVEVANKASNQNNQPSDNTNIIIVSSELKGVEYSLAQCCQPQLGDDIYAYPSKFGIRIHRRDCPNSVDILGRHGDRVLPAQWEAIGDDGTQYALSVTALDEQDLIAHIHSLCLHHEGIRYLSKNSQTNNGQWQATYTISAQHIQDVRNLLASIEALNKVFEVRLID